MIILYLSITTVFFVLFFSLRFSPFSLSYFISLTDYQGLFSDHSYIFLHFIIYTKYVL